jgi:ferredoxin
MNTGPKVDATFDIALTEIVTDGEHCFVLEVGSEKGKALLERIPHLPAQPADEEKASNAIRLAGAQMRKSLNTENIKQLLYESADHIEWDSVAKRCLTCANCTMVCPTCFCSTVEDVTDLTGDHASRWRRWDSCFTLDFARVAGGSFRSSAKSRYRQWMTHKLASWEDQFGTSGCVGCGRCITWCPVGIDITEEVRAIRGESVVGDNAAKVTS